MKICDDGVIKYKARELVGDDFPLVGRDTGTGKGRFAGKICSKETKFSDCEMHGTLYCDGDLIEVLNSMVARIVKYSIDFGWVNFCK